MKLVDQIKVKFIKKRNKKQNKSKKRQTVIMFSGENGKVVQGKKAQLQHTRWLSSEQYLKGPDHANTIHIAFSYDTNARERGKSEGCYIINTWLLESGVSRKCPNLMN